MQSIYDRNRALDKLGGDEELLGEVEAVFCGDFPQMLDKMKAALQGGQAVQLQRLAHTMKGSVSPFCASRALDAANSLEEIAKSGVLDQAPLALRRCEEEIHALVRCFSPQ